MSGVSDYIEMLREGVDYTPAGSWGFPITCEWCDAQAVLSAGTLPDQWVCIEPPGATNALGSYRPNARYACPPCAQMEIPNE